MKILALIAIFILGVSAGYTYCDEHEHSAIEKIAFDYGMQAGWYDCYRTECRNINNDPRIPQKDHWVEPAPDPSWYCQWGEYFEKVYGK